MTNSYYAVIPAAGQGKRMNQGKNKQFLLIQGVPLLIHTLRVFEEDILCSGIILAVNEKEISEIEELIFRYQIMKVTAIVPGGKERQESVFEGLKALKGNPIVFIHDGARPLLEQRTAGRLLEDLVQHLSGGAVSAVPVKDTMKLVKEGKVVETIDRSSLWSIQTPQAFYREEILRAHEKAKADDYFGTDDASLLEHYGGEVRVIEGSYENFKVTTPEDLLFAEVILKKRKGADHT